jgi:hypothetical protein
MYLMTCAIFPGLFQCFKRLLGFKTPASGNAIESIVCLFSMCSYNLIAPFLLFTHVSIYRSDVFVWLKSLSGFESHRYTRGLLAATALGGRRFARKDSFKAAYKLFDQHIGNAQTRIAGSVVRPPLMATCGSPGSGKSFLLDELSAFHPADVNTFALPASRAYFDSSNVLALNVTFNSDTANDARFDTSAQQSLSLRILFSYVLWFLAPLLNIYFCRIMKYSHGVYAYFGQVFQTSHRLVV